MKIPNELKRRCLEARNTMTTREIYKTVFCQEHDGMEYSTFKRRLNDWGKQTKFADVSTLHGGTYPKFVANNATVQVNSSGDVVQAWIKQSAIQDQYDELLETIKANTTPIEFAQTDEKPTDRMLEIALYDMHFGLPNDYSNVLTDLTKIVSGAKYCEIHIVLGQDLFHNDDFRGRTAKGTPIDKVDIPRAWEDAKQFWCSAIRCCIENSSLVKVEYIKGNHDESLCWAFVQMLKAMFPQIKVDDSLNKRKCIYWDGCFVGLTHGNETKCSPNDLRGQMTINFPRQFADAKVREIHAGHLHHEREADIYGVMCRRLSTANTTDRWSDDEGYIGNHKRFMVFEFVPNKLKTIHYLYKE